MRTANGATIRRNLLARSLAFAIAMPLAGVEALVAFMQDFQRRNG